MRSMKLLALLGLVLAVSGTAWATAATQMVIDGQVIMGPVQFKYVNFDVGTIYTVGTTGNDAQPGLTYIGASTLAGLAQTPAANAMSGENSWGIFRVSEVDNADTGDTIVSLGSGNKNVELTGIFWGEQDTYLYIDPFSGVESIHGTGVHMAIYMDTTPDYRVISPNTPAGPSFRTSADTYPTVTDGTLVLTFNSVPGALAHSTDEFFTNFQPSNTSVSGGNMYMDAGANAAGTGIWNDLVGKNTIGGADASDEFTGKAAAPSTGGWLVLSNDPVTLTAIPEPLTMMSAFMAISGLGVYVRRRMKVTAE